jgi:hypothetical protein
MTDAEYINTIAQILNVIGNHPDDANAHLLLGQILLARGEFMPGWIEYEWRNKIQSEANTPLPPITSPVWNGMRLPGRILLIGDQGYGDTIQFARYIPLVAAKCQEVIIGCSPELAPLMQSVNGVTEVHSEWAKIPPHAVHIRMSSLPYVFQTTLDTIPHDVPYINAPVTKVRDEYAKIPGMRVGIAWAGRPTHLNDANRSIPLWKLNLFDLSGITFVSLQKPLPDDDVKYQSEDNFMLFTDLLHTFGETAELIDSLDLVITVDTAIAHLAGALNKPVWVMLPEPADWRWLENTNKSPWYPSMRLFRQKTQGDWDEVIHRVHSTLADVLLDFNETGKPYLDYEE